MIVHAAFQEVPSLTAASMSACVCVCVCARARANTVYDLPRHAVRHAAYACARVCVCVNMNATFAQVETQLSAFKNALLTGQHPFPLVSAAHNAQSHVRGALMICISRSILVPDIAQVMLTDAFMCAC